MNKPTQQEFKETVADYINAGLGEIADVLEIVETWTDEYKQEFQLAILDWRANA
jgi:uncharacterized protein YecA (UPF0149 family)